MRLYLLLFLAFLLSSTTMAQPDYYHLEIESENVEFRCFINGLPVYQSSDENESTVSLPVQLYLIDKDNKLIIEAKAIDKSKAGKVHAHFAEYQNGEIVATDDLRDGGPSMDMDVVEADQKELIFDNKRFDFSKTLTSGNVLSSAEVQAYAMKLWSYRETGDAAGFVDEMAIKITDYAAANPFTEEQMREGLTSQFAQTFFKDKASPITKDNINLESYVDGRIWEIKIDGEEFLKLREDGGSMQMEVYVAKIDGKLGIVR